LGLALMLQVIICKMLAVEKYYLTKLKKRLAWIQKNVIILEVESEVSMCNAAASFSIQNKRLQSMSASMTFEA